MCRTCGVQTVFPNTATLLPRLSEHIGYSDEDEGKCSD